MIRIPIGQACIELKRGKFKCRAVPMNMSNQRMHWAEKSKWTKAWKEEVLSALKITVTQERPELPLDHPTIKIIFYHCKFFDKDGSYNAAKPIVDGLKECGVIEDDSPDHINLKVEQKKAATRQEEKTLILIK